MNWFEKDELPMDWDMKMLGLEEKEWKEMLGIEENEWKDYHWTTKATYENQGDKVIPRKVGEIRIDAREQLTIDPIHQNFAQAVMTNFFWVVRIYRNRGTVGPKYIHDVMTVVFVNDGTHNYSYQRE